ncbi:MAG: hypothetical protein K0R82_1908 [Flavipsychrobacter sp.]|jgi:hypothetical protein|nr:hypothetical protein [Flavipsychrobacter sp.]
MDKELSLKYSANILYPCKRKKQRVMRNKILVAVLALSASTIFGSCTKFYNCECTDHQGKVSQHTIHAKTKGQADNKCDDQGELENCEIK